MYYDLSIPWPATPVAATASSSGAANAKTKQSKGKQRETNPPGPLSSAGARTAVDSLTDEQRNELRRCVQTAIKLGYSTVAFNLILPPGAFDATTLASLNPCANAKPVFPDLDQRTASTSDGRRTALQLSRVTAVLDEGSINGGKGNGSMFTSSNASILSGFNIISALPLDAAAFSHVCLNLAGPGPSSVDIITLDLAASARLPFQLKRTMVLKALADGAVFEICYGAALRSSSAAAAASLQNPNTPERSVPKDARRNVIAGARELIRVTNGKGVILSSEVRRCMELRAPLDLCNLGAILGLKNDQAKAAVSGNARLAVIRGHAHRSTYRGVIGNPTVVVTTTKDTSLDPAASTSEDTQQPGETAEQLGKRKRDGDMEDARQGQGQRRLKG